MRGIYLIDTSENKLPIFLFSINYKLLLNMERNESNLCFDRIRLPSHRPDLLVLEQNRSSSKFKVHSNLLPNKAYLRKLKYEIRSVGMLFGV